METQLLVQSPGSCCSAERMGCAVAKAVPAGRVCWPQWCRLELSIAQLLLKRVELACPCDSVEHTRGPTPRFLQEPPEVVQECCWCALPERRRVINASSFPPKQAGLLSRSVLETPPQCCMDVGTCQCLDNRSSDTAAFFSSMIYYLVCFLKNLGNFSCEKSTPCWRGTSQKPQNESIQSG